MKDKKTEIIVKWILCLTILTFAFFLIILFMPLLTQKTNELLGKIGESEKLFVMMLVCLWWFLGMVFGVKYCCDELKELESNE